MRFATAVGTVTTLGVTIVAFAAKDAPAFESRLVAPESQAETSPVSETPTSTAEQIGGSTAVRVDCPSGMLLVEGNYCPKVRQTCLSYLDMNSGGRYAMFRCAKYGTPKCLSASRVSMRFCMDRDEYASKGKKVPDNFRSFTDAERLCGAQNKRVCRESEWNFACEGEQMRPYPYGFERDSSACNADHLDVVGSNGKLRDLRAPSDAYPRCESPFGIRNLTGNLEEFVAIDGSMPVRPAMKGAYWQPSRNFCRAAQTAHDRYYNGTETGFRCCADAPRN